MLKAQTYTNLANTKKQDKQFKMLKICKRITLKESLKNSIIK